jgi:O-antigen ligase
MGPIGTLSAQLGLIWGLMFSMGAVQDLPIPPAAGLLSLMLVLGSALLAPRRVIMEFPISFSILGIFTISIASVMWTIDSAATQANLRALIPSMLAIVIAAGLLTLRDLTDGLIWAIRITLILTLLAIVLLPSARAHTGLESGVEGYAGWHGFFNHKNNMSAFLVISIPTLLVFHRPGLLKWMTLGTVGVLVVGSSSATGFSSAFFAVAAYVWVRIYQNQSREDTRNSTLLFLASVLGSIGIAAAALTSIATVTSAYGKDTTLSGRTLIWDASLDALARRPWFGHGFGALFWREQQSNETLEIWRQVGFENSHAHNGPLQLALEVGLVGLAIFLVLWVSTFYRGWQALDKQPDIGTWVVCIVSANLLMSLSEDVLSSGWIALFAALKIVLMRREESLRWPSWRAGPIDKWAYR